MPTTSRACRSPVVVAMTSSMITCPHERWTHGIADGANNRDGGNARLETFTGWRATEQTKGQLFPEIGYGRY